MPSPSPLPDAMPLRDALRGLRHAVRRGGASLLETMPVGSLPRPAADLAGAVLREVTGLASGVTEVAAGLARFALGAGDAPRGSLHDLAAQQNAEDSFAIGLYAALRAVLRRLNAPAVYISETAARSAYLALGPLRGSDAATAAALTLALVDTRVLRGVASETAATVPGPLLEPVALFAVMLWLQSDRSEAEDEATLIAATDLAIAVAPEAASALQARDAARLETLYAEFAAHV